MTIRVPACCPAVSARARSSLASLGFMLPIPTNTGGGPAVRNSSRAAGGDQAGGLTGHQYPATSMPSRQSAGRGTTDGLKP